MGKGDFFSGLGRFFWSVTTGGTVLLVRGQREPSLSLLSEKKEKISNVNLNNDRMLIYEALRQLPAGEKTPEGHFLFRVYLGFVIYDRKKDKQRAKAFFRGSLPQRISSAKLNWEQEL